MLQNYHLIGKQTNPQGKNESPSPIRSRKDTAFARRTLTFLTSVTLTNVKK